MRSFFIGTAIDGSDAARSQNQVPKETVAMLAVCVIWPKFSSGPPNTAKMKPPDLLAVPNNLSEFRDARSNSHSLPRVSLGAETFIDRSESPELAKREVSATKFLASFKFSAKETVEHSNPQPFDTVVCRQLAIGLDLDRDSANTACKAAATDNTPTTLFEETVTVTCAIGCDHCRDSEEAPQATIVKEYETDTKFNPSR
jgi:hypothetical protein